MKSLWSDKFLKLSPKQRKKTCNKKKKRSYTKVQQRKNVKHYTKEQLISWGKQHNLLTVRDLWKFAKIYEDCPTYKNVLKQFGSWGNYKKGLGVISISGFPNGLDDRQYIQLCINLGIQGDKKSYEQKYKKYKGILLSVGKVINIYGSWYNFKRLIYSLNVDKILQSYVLKSMQIGHALTLEQCDKYNIQIRRAMDCYGKKIFNLLIRQKQKQIYLSIIGEIDEK